MSSVATLTLGNHDHPDSSALMYSFFKVQPRSKADASVVNGSREGTDGHDPILPQPEHFPRSNVTNFESNATQGNLHAQPASNPRSEISEAYDPSGDRRKRRKVSVGPEDTVFESKQWNLLPPPRIIERRQRDPGEKPSPDVLAVDAVSPRKRRDKPPKALLAKHNAQDVVDDTLLSSATGSIEMQNITTQSPKQAGSARKKSMRLTAKGTLLSSPSSSQELRPTRKASSQKTLVKKNPGNLTLKNGKFTQTLDVGLKYQTADIGRRIDEILATELSSKPAKTVPDAGRVDGNSGKTTHPFFLGRVMARPQDSTAPDFDSKPQESREEEAKKAVPWKDIVFKTKKPSFSKALQKPAWPPHVFQHVGRLTLDQSDDRNYAVKQNKQKAKQIVTEIPQDENVLYQYTKSLLPDTNDRRSCTPCERILCTSREVLDQLQLDEDILSQSMPVRYAREKALTSLSPFDRGNAPGPLPWSQKYGPTKWEEVLQPDCRKLHDWLKGLAIHHVQSGTEKGGSKLPAKRRKKSKKRDDEFSDFVVDDFDDQDVSKIKNAILIVGPNGCGKTASVFAVAKQLGFEVFEIHPGMRRSQKDIFDKVGDMAKNHLVQGGNALSRDSSILPETENSHESNDPAQQPISNLFSKPTNKLAKSPRSATPLPTKEQKQSLILFEEVDHVFEEDRGFWSGVQALIEGSKRPVVMTCNTLQGIPIDELDLFTILSFSCPSTDVVGEYLSYIAAAEGHIIEPGVVRSLYATKHCDLRATMMELDLWCQMTIGSEKGGLDWIPHYDFSISKNTQKSRVISRNAFTMGMDLLPVSYSDVAESLSFLDYNSQLSLSLSLEHGLTTSVNSQSASSPEMIEILATGSDADLLDKSMQAFMAARMWPVDKSDLLNLRYFAQKYCSEIVPDPNENINIRFDVLQPLSSEKSIFPPSQGRLAPSLDESRRVIATDLAPYVRSIAAYDLGLEACRDEVSSSQGRKVRTTRAARAAAEGGDKGSTRPERWLPSELNLRDVLETGGNWPRWPLNTHGSLAGSLPSSPSTDERQFDQPMPDYIHRPELTALVNL